MIFIESERTSGKWIGRIELPDGKREYYGSFGDEIEAQAWLSSEDVVAWFVVRSAAAAQDPAVVVEEIDVRV